MAKAPKKDEAVSIKTVTLHRPGHKPVKAEVVSSNNENNLNLTYDGEHFLSVIRKENHNFNQLNNLNYFTELSE